MWLHEEVRLRNLGINDFILKGKMNPNLGEYGCMLVLLLLGQITNKSSLGKERSLLLTVSEGSFWWAR